MTDPTGESKQRNREIAANESSRQTTSSIRVSVWAILVAVVIGLVAYATAPVGKGTSTIRSMRRSPRMIAGCIRATTCPVSRARRALSAGLSAPWTSISSAERAMTSAASLASTA